MHKTVAARCLPVLFFLYFNLSNALAGTFPVFGSESFERGTGSPVIISRTFSAPTTRTQYQLQIEVNQVSSAIIKINNEPILEPADFNQTVSSFYKVVALSQINKLSVELRGKPGGSLSISIVGVDNTPPTIHYALNPSPNENMWHNRDVTVSFLCADDFSGINFCSPPVVVDTEQANNMATGTAADFAGNTASITSTINIDKSEPVISFNTPQYTNQSPLAVEGSISEANDISSTRINNALVTVNNSQFSATVHLTEGSNYIEVTATDIAGNTGSLTKHVVLDTIPPLIPNEALISLSDIVNGDTVITGSNQSVESNVLVSVTNNSTNDTNTAQSQIDGRFTLLIAANPGDILTLIATDSATNQSDALNLQIPSGSGLPIQIDYPQQDDILNSHSVSVSGTFSAPAGAGITVNGQPAFIIGDQFFANNVYLDPGENTIVARVVSIEGNDGQSELTVTRDDTNQPSAFVVAKHDTGYGPLITEFYIVPRDGITPNRIYVDYNNDGNFEETQWYSKNNPIKHQFSNGVHTVSFRVVDTNYNYNHLSHQVIALDLIQLDSLLVDTFSTMKQHLIAGDISGALAYFAPYRRDEFLTLFSNLGSNLTNTAADFGTLKLDSVRGQTAQYILLKSIQGTTIGSPVIFTRNTDGVWRIDDM
ncbi:MAG TPA: hypothetical protein VIM41_01555 [Gammaproteobacteria bacterium]